MRDLSEFTQLSASPKSGPTAFMRKQLSNRPGLALLSHVCLLPTGGGRGQGPPPPMGEYGGPPGNAPFHGRGTGCHFLPTAPGPMLPL
eukprot:scaffold90809_cov20-Prasinocladus_malaysianus.AAC.2